MNEEFKILRKEVIDLKKQIENIYRSIRLIEPFIKEKGKYYTFEESIKAIKDIISILNEKKKELLTLKEEFRKKNIKLISSCQHEILVEDASNNFCVICGDLIITLPNTSCLQITVHNKVYWKQVDVQNKIQEIIDKGMESDDLLGYVKEELEELQFKEDISIRRLTK